MGYFYFQPDTRNTFQKLGAHAPPVHQSADIPDCNVVSVLTYLFVTTRTLITKNPIFKA